MTILVRKKIIFYCIGAGKEKGGVFQYSLDFIKDFIHLGGSNYTYICISDDDEFLAIAGCEHIIVKKQPVESKKKRFLRLLVNYSIFPRSIFRLVTQEPEFVKRFFGDERVKIICLSQRADLIYYFGKIDVSVIHDAPRAWDHVSRRAHSLGYALQFDAECSKIISNSRIVLTDSTQSERIISAKYRCSGLINSLPFKIRFDNLQSAVSDSEIKRHIDLLRKEVRGYFYYPSTVHPIKNHRRLIEAIGRLNRYFDLSLGLILSGPIDSNIELLLKVAERAGVKALHLGYVSESEKIELLRLSVALVMPSLFNFANIPVLEGLAARVKVVCSDKGSIRELTKDQCIYINPESVDSLVSGLLFAAFDWLSGGDVHRHSFDLSGLVQSTDAKRYQVLNKILHNFRRE